MTSSQPTATPASLPPAGPPPARRRRAWPLRLLGGLALGLVALLVVLLGLVASLLLFPPSDLLRRAALPIARQALNHPLIQIGALDLRPLDHLVIEDLWLGPPAGYARPLLTIKRLVVRYDLSGLARGELRLRQLELERPLIQVEAREGKLNWLAFLEGLPKSAEQPPPEEPGEPPDLRVWLERIAVSDFGAFVDDGVRRLVLDSLSLAVSGFYSKQKSHLDLGLRLHGQKDEQARLSFLQRAPERLGARLKSTLALDVHVDQLLAPRAQVKLALDLASEAIESPWPLEPLQLALRLAAKADLPGDRAELENLSLSFNQTELLQLAAKLEALSDAEQQHIDLLLRKLHLPLDLLAPYARAVVPGVDFGGDVRVSELQLAGYTAALQAQKLPVLSGQLALERLWATIKRPELKARLKDFTVKLALATPAPGQPQALTPAAIVEALPALSSEPALASLVQPQQPSPPVALQGYLKLGSFEGLGAQLRGLELRLASGLLLAGSAPQAFASHLALRLPQLRYRHPQLGPVALGLQSELRAHGDLGQKAVTLSQLDLALGDVLKAHLSASVEDFGAKRLAAELELEPVELPRLLALVPGPLKAPLGRAKLKGRVGLKAKLRGRTPAPATPPFKLPVELDARVTLAGLGLDDPDRQLKLAELGGTISVQGPPRDLQLHGQLAIAELHKPDQALRVRGLRLPLEARVTPGSITAQLELGLSRVQKKDLGLDGQGLELAVGLQARTALTRLAAGLPAALQQAQLTLGAGVKQLALNQPGNSLRLRELQTDLGLDYDPQRPAATRLTFKTRLAGLDHAQQKAKLRGLAVALQSELTGPRLQLPAPRPADLHLERATVALDLGLASVEQAGLLEPPLRQNTIKAELTFDGDQLQLSPLAGNGDLTLQRLAVRLPSRGIKLDLQGSVGRLLSLGPGGPLPPFDLTLAAGLDTPQAKRAKDATFLVAGLKGAGQLGLTLRARRLAPDRVGLEGTLLAKAFHLWQRGTTVQEQDSGNLLRTERLLHVAEMNAHVPISQQLIVDLPRWSLPPPQTSIFETQSASVLYRSLQPYRGGEARLTLGGLTLDERLTEMTAAGHFISTAKRHNAIDKLALDLAIADSTLLLRRLYVKLFGGDVAGEIQAQLLRLKPLDLRLVLKTQVTGVNLAYLDPAAQEITDKTAVSALVDLSYAMCRRQVAGGINITRLSLPMLDALLAYLDPNKTNESLQNNRELINAWYTKWVNPKVQLVAISLNHGNLNMDIEMEAWFFIGTILKRTLKNMRIRRLSILPFLPKCPQEAPP